MAGSLKVSDDRLDGVVRVLLDTFAEDRMRYSEIFEPSFSVDADGLHLYRFSYAFPGFRADPSAVLETIIAMCSPFGDKIAGYARQLLATAEDPCVEQVLFGLAYDGRQNWRVKLYVQFGEREDDRSLSLAGKLVGLQKPEDRFVGKSLHLLGIDLGAGGIRQVKFYFLNPDIPSWVGEVGLISYLGSTGTSQLDDLLTIHRMRRIDDSGLDIAVEVDFPLITNELHFKDLVCYPELGALISQNAPVGELESKFDPAYRRISFPIGVMDKVNVYYVLTGMDPA